MKRTLRPFVFSLLVMLIWVVPGGPLRAQDDDSLKTMLADDPDLRPRSMNEVAAILARVVEGERVKAAIRPLEMAPASVKVIGRLKKRQR
ncbi:MAG: hypothetical protein KJ645_14695, partial [Planctomycetes bacterium]|nr:hypothetical protein [Planctomycetota bacterium]